MGNFMVKQPTRDRLHALQYSYLQQASEHPCKRHFLSAVSLGTRVSTFLAWFLIAEPNSFISTRKIFEEWSHMEGERHVLSFTIAAANSPNDSAARQQGHLACRRGTIYIAPLSQWISYRSVLRASFSCLFLNYASFVFITKFNLKQLLCRWVKAFF